MSTSLPNLSDAQRIEWLRLIRSENVGPQTFYTLLNHYGSARAALEAIPELSAKGGLRREIKIASKAEAEREIERSARLGVRFIALGESDYPALLKEINAPPPLLAVRGQARVFEKPIIGIVGSRNASSVALKIAGTYAKDLGLNGFAIASGLARGVDAAAHIASLHTGTIGALAGGHAKPYPSEHIKLIDEICEQGAVISEMPLEWEPRARDFPRRNRLISGVSRGVLVIEAAERSGSLITARLANEEGREVFAIPGSPLDPRAAGTNRLIKQGATLVMGLDDILENITHTPTKPKSFAEPYQDLLDFDETNPQRDALREKLFNTLSSTPFESDEIIEQLKIAPSLARGLVLELLLAGRIEQNGSKLSITV
jgi:DNA processing protein